MQLTVLLYRITSIIKYVFLIISSVHIKQLMGEIIMATKITKFHNDIAEIIIIIIMRSYIAIHSYISVVHESLCIGQF